MKFFFKQNSFFIKQQGRKRILFFRKKLSVLEFDWGTSFLKNINFFFWLKLPFTFLKLTPMSLIHFDKIAKGRKGEGAVASIVRGFLSMLWHSSYFLLQGSMKPWWVLTCTSCMCLFVVLCWYGWPPCVMFECPGCCTFSLVCFSSYVVGEIDVLMLVKMRYMVIMSNMRNLLGH